MFYHIAKEVTSLADDFPWVHCLLWYRMLMLTIVGAAVNLFLTSHSRPLLMDIHVCDLLMPCEWQPDVSSPWHFTPYMLASDIGLACILRNRS